MWTNSHVFHVQVRQELWKDVFEMSSEELRFVPRVAFQTLQENKANSVLTWNNNFLLQIDDVILRCPYCNCGWMKTPLIQPDINYCGICLESKLIDVLYSIRRECGSRCMGKKFFNLLPANGNIMHKTLWDLNLINLMR